MLTINPKITFNGAEAREGILDPAFARPELRRLFTVFPGIVARQQIALVGRLNKVTQKDPGCGLGQGTKAIPMTEKYWDPVKMKIWFSQCADHLEDTYFVWGSALGYDRDDLTQNQSRWTEFVMELFEDAAVDDLLRIAFFGDKDHTNVEEGSGTELLTAGVDPDDYTMIDGLWNQVEAGVTATEVPRVSLGSGGFLNLNGQASYALQDSTLEGDSDAAYNIYKELYKVADPRLRGQSDLVLLVTESLFRNRLDEKEAKSGLESSFKRQDEAYVEDVFRGIPVISMGNVWDKYIRSDFDNGTTYDRPHRAILTTRSNLAMGFDAEGAHQAFRVYYDETDEQTHLKGKYRMDVKLLRPWLTAVAY